MTRTLFTTPMGGSIALSGLLLLVGCGKDQAALPPAADVVAQVGERVVTLGAVQAELQQRAERGQPIPSVDAVLDDLVLREALLERARVLQLEQDPAVRRELDRLLIAKVLDQEFHEGTRSIELREEELEAHYEEHKQRYTRPAMMRFALIKVEGSRLMSEGKRVELEERISEAHELASAQPVVGSTAAGHFGKVAQAFSDDMASRHRGGDLGWFETERLAARLPAELAAEAVALSVGETSPVLYAEPDWYVLRKTDERPEVVTPFDELRTAIRDSLLRERRLAIQEDYYQKVKDEAPVSLFPDQLATLQLPNSAPEQAQPPQLSTPLGMTGNL